MENHSFGSLLFQVCLIMCEFVLWNRIIVVDFFRFLSQDWRGLWCWGRSQRDPRHWGLSWRGLWQASHKGVGTSVSNGDPLGNACGRHSSRGAPLRTGVGLCSPLWIGSIISAALITSVDIRAAL